MLTERGYMSIAPVAVSKGDLCGIALGGENLRALRATETESWYQFVESTYILSRTVAAAVRTRNVMGANGRKDSVD